MINPDLNAALYRRGAEPLVERWVAGGTMLEMVRRFLREDSVNQRTLYIIHEGMEFQPAEIKNLASQDLFRDGERDLRRAVGRDMRLRR
jgi:hypothetical protein